MAEQAHVLAHVCQCSTGRGREMSLRAGSMSVWPGLPRATYMEPCLTLAAPCSTPLVPGEGSQLDCLCPQSRRAGSATKPLLSRFCRPTCCTPSAPGPPPPHLSTSLGVASSLAMSCLVMMMAPNRPAYGSAASFTWLWYIHMMLLKSLGPGPARSGTSQV